MVQTNKKIQLFICLVPTSLTFQLIIVTIIFVAGRSGWSLPVTELEFPPGLDRYRWFALFFLDGSVCPNLKKFTKNLLSTPKTMVKSWAK